MQTLQASIAATPAGFAPMARQLAGAYTQVHASTRVAGADSHQLVSMLFQGLQDALNEARGALRRQDVGLKCQALTRAARIVDEGLKAGLNVQSGGEVAQNLSLLYEYMGMTLTRANLRNDESLIEEVQRLIVPVQDAWARIQTASHPTN